MSQSTSRFKHKRSTTLVPPLRHRAAMSALLGRMPPPTPSPSSSLPSTTMTATTFSSSSSCTSAVSTFDPTSSSSNNQSPPMMCSLHGNFFHFVRNSFQRCTLADQLALFTFVDQHVDPNHVIYHLMREALCEAARVCENKGGRLTHVTKKNLIVIDDGLMQISETHATRQPHDPYGDQRITGHRRLVLRSSRDYRDCCPMDANRLADILPHRQPYTQLDQARKRKLETSREFEFFDRQTTSNAADDNDQEDDDEDGEDDEVSNVDFLGDYGDEVAVTASRIAAPTSRATSTPRNNIASHAARQRRNVHKLFSVSAKSIQQLYNETCDLLNRFWQGCETRRFERTFDGRDANSGNSTSTTSGNSFRGGDGGGSGNGGQYIGGVHIVRHITYLIQTNNIQTNVVRSLRLCDSSDENTANGIDDQEDTTCDSVATVYNCTLVDTDSAPEANLDRYDSAWPMNEEWQLTGRLEPVIASDIIADDSVHGRMSATRLAARRLQIRVLETRSMTQNLLARHTPLASATNTSSCGALSGGLDANEDSDERRVFQLTKFTPTGQPMSAAEFRVRHEREFSLVALGRAVRIVCDLAATSRYCLKVFDFALTAPSDFWLLMNRVLDYGIESQIQHGVYPAKHALWDLGLVRRGDQDDGTLASYRLANYQLLWFHAPTLLAGNLTLFVQSFRRMLLMCYNTAGCFLLNRANADAINRRKLGGKHNCRLAKASQNAYQAIFLRTTWGHELLCTARIENHAEAVAWLTRYAELAEMLWVKCRVPKSRFVSSHLNSLRPQATTRFSGPTTTPAIRDRVASAGIRTVAAIDDLDDRVYDDAVSLTEDGSLLDYKFDDDDDDDRDD